MTNDGSPPIYTIGYGRRPAEEILALLHRYGIQELLDVRSQPYSRFQPAFSRKPLAEALARAGIRYVFMGDLLGGRPADPALYRDGRVDYAALARTPAYHAGFQRLVKAWREGRRVCLLCAEERPENCHRSRLIGRSLSELGIPVLHIDGDGSTVDQATVMERLSGGQQTLFDMP